jgi:hypothetical protein
VLDRIPPGVSVFQQDGDLRFRAPLRIAVLEVDESVSYIASRPYINDGVVLKWLVLPAELLFGRSACVVSYPGKPEYWLAL